MNKEYTLKPSNANVEEVKSRIIADLNQRIGAGQDCKVQISDLNFRGNNAVKAYWVLIGSVVKWNKEQGNCYTEKNFDEWFKKEVGLTEEIDMLGLWKMSYKNELEEGYKIIDLPTSENYILQDVVADKYTAIPLGKRFVERTRSISSKGDVTKEEMSRLLMTVLKFGAENKVPNCFIEDTELKNMLKSYDR